MKGSGQAPQHRGVRRFWRVVTENAAGLLPRFVVNKQLGKESAAVEQQPQQQREKNKQDDFLFGLYLSPTSFQVAPGSTS